VRPDYSDLVRAFFGRHYVNSTDTSDIGNESVTRGFLVILALMFSTPALAWWNCSWDYRFAADISTPSGPTLSGYQVRLDLDAGNVPAEFDWSTGGDDLRIIDQDDLSELDFFIEQWDEFARTAVVWVRVPSIPGGGRTVYLYFGGPTGATSTSTTLTFTETGVRFYTRNSSADPADLASAEAAFAAAPGSTNGYGCSIITAYTGVNNSSLFGPPNRNNDIGLFAEAFFEVTAAQAGTWQFRYGADFGRGGGLYVDDVPLEESWNDDLWWANNWNNASEVLQGSINLSPGTHSIRIIGFEGCCDGGLTAQFRPPGGAWQALAVANLNLISAKCPVSSEPVVSFGPVETTGCPDFTITRSSQTLSDPINGTIDPKAIPGAVILNEIAVYNSGPGAADASSFIITDALDAAAALRVADFDGVTAGPLQFLDGAIATGMTFTFTALGDIGDDLAFSSDGGLSFSYTPVPDANGVDPAVTHIRITPSGQFQGDSGSGTPSATFLFKTVIP
jgi:hypothetical protein